MKSDLHLETKKFHNLFYVGMGGSALVAEVFNNLYQDKQPLEIIRHYNLPKRASKKDLVIAASFSGNTEETLSGFFQAKEEKIPLLAFSHNGKLKKICEKEKISHITLPECIQPRYALGYFFGSLLALFYRLKLLPSQEKNLSSLEKFLTQAAPKLAKQGHTLADFFFKKIPLIYGAESIKSALKIFKIKINENAKAPAFYNVFPELNHNEMVGLQHLPSATALLLLENEHSHPRIKKRLKVFSKLTKLKNSKQLIIKNIKLPGKTIIEEVFAAILLGDYTSYYLAKKYKVDPVPVVMVEEFKKKLAQ